MREKFNQSQGPTRADLEAGKRWQENQLADIKDRLAKTCDAFLNEAGRLKGEISYLEKIERHAQEAGSLESESGRNAEADVAAQRENVKRIAGQVRMWEEYIRFEEDSIARAEENIRWLKTREEEYKKSLLTEPSRADLLDTTGQNN